MNNFEIVKFIDNDFELEVRTDKEGETVWLNTNQISVLFERDYKTIRKHISNALNEELDEKMVVAKFENTTRHGAMEGKSQTHDVTYYNLDMIISIGYRVKSKRGIIFRKWANKVLKDYLINGYAVNDKRLEKLNKVIDIQNKMLASALDIDTKSLENVISKYTKALDLLDDYDHQKIVKPSGDIKYNKLLYIDVRKLIDSMRFGAKSNLFGVEKETGKLNGILEAVYQNVFGEEVYKTVEDKAAHLLYFIVKDHPFADGCKRIAATTFLEFLNINNKLVKNGKLLISNNTLVAITLLCAESKPEEMDIILNVIMHFIKGDIYQ